MDSIKPIFIESVQHHVGSWTPPVFHALNDPAWKTAWAQSTAAQRTNLGNAWVWRYTEGLKELTEQSVRSTWLDNWAWIADIVPYTGDSFLKVSDLTRSTETHEPNEHLRNLAGAAWSQVRDMWFGETPEIKLAALIDFIEARHESQIRNLYGPLLAELAWAVATLPEATTTHQLYAGKLSIHGGYIFTANENACQSAQLWSRLRRHAKMNFRSPLSVEAKTRLRTMLGEEPACVALPLFLVLIERNWRGKTERNTALPKEHLLAFGCNGDAYPYEVLRAWFPQNAKVFNVTETLGLNIEEACQQIVESKQECLGVHLPNDMDSFEVND